MRGAFPTLFPYGKADFNILQSRTVTLAVYAKHILKYQDGRFGRYPLFRYYVFNQIIREQALNATHFLCRRLNKNGLSLDKLNNLINGSRGDQVLNKIIQHVRKLKGTRPYWKQKRNKLTAYAKNIKSGSLFFTLSAANLYWHNLYSYIPLFNEYKAADKAQRYRIASQNLNNNPYIAAYWLHRRFNLFRKHMLIGLFNSTNFQSQYKQQVQGSGYIYSFLQSLIALKPDLLTSKLRAAFAKHQAAFISIINPD